MILKQKTNFWQKLKILLLFFVLYTIMHLHNICWCGSMAEQLIRNEQVAGSIPVTSSKKEVTFGKQKLLLFLSKPQAWHIITARSAVHIISPFGAVSHHAPACILLRLDEMQHCVLMIYRNKLRMIYKASP